MGISVVEIGDGGTLSVEPWYRRDIEIFGGQLSLPEQSRLAEEMATILRARLPVLEMLRILAEGDQRPATRTRLLRVAHQVSEGTDLASAFERSGPKVSPVFIALLRAGQKSDSLPQQLSGLARMLRRQEKSRSQVITALIYPTILSLAAIAVVIVVSLTIAPALVPLFESQNVPLPRSVAAFFAFGKAIAATWPWVLGGVTAGTFATIVILKNNWANIAIRLPVFGALARDAALLTLLRSLSLIVKSGVPLAEALRATAKFDRAAPFAPTVHAAADALERGGHAHEAFHTDSRLPTTIRELFRVGEETNSLDEVLETLADAQADRLERRTQRLLRILTPILTLIIGAVIGMLVVSIMDAVFSVNALAI